MNNQETTSCGKKPGAFSSSTGKAIYSRKKHALSLLLSVLMVISAVVGQQGPDIPFSPKCTRQNLPMTAGGSRDDVAHCLVYDPASELIIVGGITQSSDFGPSNTENGFLYAINLDGDWVWGNYYRNATGRSISTITGCQLSSDGTQVVILGATQEQVVMGVVNATTGQMTNLYSLENKEGAKRDAEPPEYKTYGAIMLDSRDPQDRKAHIYASFLMDDEQQLVRILQAVPDRTNEFPELEYHFSMVDFTKEEIEQDIIRRKTPQYMFQLPQQEFDESFYMTGAYRGLGSIMKFYKRNGVLRWHARLDKLTRVEAIAIWKTSSLGKFFGCGSNNYDDREISRGLRPSDSDAWFFAMEADGQMNWLFQLAGQATEAGTLHSDSCQGLVFDTKTEQLVAVVETNSPQFRVQRENQQKDMMLLEIDLNGGLGRAISITLGSNQYEMLSFAQNLIQANSYYYTAGQLYGYQTRTQMDSYSDADKNLDTYLFPLAYTDRATERCFLEREQRGSDFNRFKEFFNRRQVEPEYKLNKNDDRAVPKLSQSERVFGLYYSKFGSSQSLNSFIKTPRPCAFQSLQLTDKPVEYLRGSQSLKFSIAEESVYAPLITQMAPTKGGVTRVIDQTGRETELAKFSADNGGEVEFFTNVQRRLGLNELIIKHCDIYERLFDLRLPIDVKRNAQPLFRDAPQRIFNLAVGESLVYTFPEIIDPQGNAEAEILIEPYANFTDLYPPFQQVFNGNRTFDLNPDKEEYAGKSYFFKVTLREQGSNAIGNVYTFQVNVDGLEIDGSGQDGQQQTDGSSSGGSSSGSSSSSSSGNQNGSGANSGGSSTNDQTSTGGGTSSGSSSGTTGGNTQVKLTGRMRSGSVITTDTFAEVLARQFKFLEIYTTDIIGRTQIKFVEPVDMARVEADIEELFVPKIQKADYFYDRKNITLKDIAFTNFNVTNQTVDVALTFEDPFSLGLNLDKSDFIYFFVNETYPWSTNILQVQQRRNLQANGMVMGKPLQTAARSRIELTFDYSNSTMETVVVFSTVFEVTMVCFIAIQLILLTYKNVGLLTFWTLIDYAQLIAFLPLQTSRFVPYVYEAYRPFLLSHLIYAWPGDPGFDQQDSSEFFTLSYQAYDLTKGVFIEQSALTWAIFLVAIICFDVAIYIMKRTCSSAEGKCPKLYAKLAELHSQFRWNVYIRYLMLAYIDIVLIAGIVLFDSSEEVLSFSGIVAVLVITFTFFIPLSVLFYLCQKFNQLQDKQVKQNFNTLLLKVDKEDRWRIFLPCFYFIRRFVTSVILVLGAIDKAPAYVQFSVIISLSAILMFYLAKEEPYVTRRMNIYVLLMEFIYFMLGMMAFAFTDATDDVHLKDVAATGCVIFLCLFIILNLLMAFYFVGQGRATLRQQDIQAKEKRRNDLAQAIEEKANRKIKRKRKKQKEKDAIEMKRIEQLKEKREEMKRQGYTEEDIDAKLPLEPVQKSGFKFGAVMGKRLVDYGIMSSSSDSEAEIEIMPLNKKNKSIVGDSGANLEDQRRQSEILPTHENEYDDDGRGMNEELTARKMLSADRTADMTGRSDIKPYNDESNDNWMDQLKGGDELAEGEDGEEGEEEGEEDMYGDEDDAGQYSGSQVDFADDQVNHQDPYFGQQLTTDRAMYTEANDDAEDQLNYDTQNSSRGRRNQLILPEYDDDGNQVSNAVSFNNDPWTTRNDITAQSSSQHGILANNNSQQDERIRRLAEQTDTNH